MSQENVESSREATDAFNRWAAGPPYPSAYLRSHGRRAVRPVPGLGRDTVCWSTASERGSRSSEHYENPHVEVAEIHRSGRYLLFLELVLTTSRDGQRHGDSARAAWLRLARVQTARSPGSGFSAATRTRPSKPPGCGSRRLFLGNRVFFTPSHRGRPTPSPHSVPTLPPGARYCAGDVAGGGGGEDVLVWTCSPEQDGARARLHGEAVLPPGARYCAGDVAGDVTGRHQF